MRRARLDGTARARSDPKTPAPPTVPAPPHPADAVHDLQRSMGNRATARLLRDATPLAAPPRQPVQPVRPPVRKGYVFLMGADRPSDPNRFYDAARRYWRAHRPAARMVTDVRNLVDLLTWVRTNVPENDPIGELVIVSHANEDGTLSFGLNAADTDRHLSFSELRDALASGALPRMGRRVDNQTRIHIKGCDIGRSGQMVELVDRAFGGAGTVTAPTHEQGYAFDPTLAEAAQRQAQARIRREVEALHPEPPPIDPSLRGRERIHAQSERRRALAERRRAIDAEVRGRAGEVSAAAEEAGTIEEFSGPMFQRPGDQLFSVGELRAEIDRLYAHLSEAQRRTLAQQLAARDTRSPSVQRTQGTFRQTGQRVDRRTESFTFPEPRTVQEAQRVYGSDFQREHFTPRNVRSDRVRQQGGFRVRTVVTGRFHPRGEDPFDGEMTFTAPFADDGREVVVPDTTLLRTAQSRVASPEKFRWRPNLVEDHSTRGMTTLTAVGERVIAYLHHGSLNVRPHEHFTTPLTDQRYFYTSTFAPPPTAAPRRH